LYFVINIVGGINRRGLVVKLVERGLFFESSQVKISRMIMNVFINTKTLSETITMKSQSKGEVNSVNQKDIVNLILGFYSLEKYSLECYINKPNVQGALIVQALLKYTPQYSVPYQKSLLQTSLEQLKAYTICPVASRVMDAFLESTSVTNKSKRDFAALFKSNYIDLALNKYSSRFLDKLFQKSNLLGKEVIAQELSNGKKLLEKDFFGRFCVKNFLLELYQRRPDEWKTHWSTVKREQKVYQSNGDEIDDLFSKAGK
jgi:hypothetical protein